MMDDRDRLDERDLTEAEERAKEGKPPLPDPEERLDERVEQLGRPPRRPLRDDDDDTPAAA